MYPPAIDVSNTNGVIQTAHNDDDDDSMDLGLDVTSDDMAGGEQGLVVARRLGLTPAAGSSSTLSTTTQEDADLETQVIMDAMGKFGIHFRLIFVGGSSVTAFLVGFYGLLCVYLWWAVSYGLSLCRDEARAVSMRPSGGRPRFWGVCVWG